MERFIDWERMRGTTDVTEYVHGSARYYSCSEQGIYSIMNYLELDDIDLTKTLQIDAEPWLCTNRSETRLRNRADQGHHLRVNYVLLTIVQD